MPEWQTADRSPEVVSSIRSMAIAAAAYSRAKYPELYAEFTKDQTVLEHSRQADHRLLMTRASRDLGDIINSIDMKVGNAPAIAKIAISRKYSQPSSHRVPGLLHQGDRRSGNPLEGAQGGRHVPDVGRCPNGAEPTAHDFRAYTMPDGIAKATAYIDLSKHGTKLTASRSSRPVAAAR